MITEPKWKSFIVETINPIFTPEQCQMVINAGRSEPKQNAALEVIKVMVDLELILKQEHHISVGYLLRKRLRCIKI